MAKLADEVEVLKERVTQLEAKIAEIKPRDRGPKSTRQMTEEDARNVIWGDLKDLSHKAAAKELGLSYGQIYSARGEFTFKKLWSEFWDAKAKAKKA